MKIGAQVSCYLTTWDDIRKVVEYMDKGRWHSIYHADHFVPPLRPGSSEAATAFEGFLTLGSVASITTNLKLGHLVLGNPYRNPGLVAKMAGTIDHISKGRFTLGIGAGWFEREHKAYGWDFPSVKERSDRLEEACLLIRSLLTSETPVNHEGTYYKLDNAVLSPGSAQSPHIPIMVGGTGEKRTLKTLAKYGDVFNLDGFAAKGYGGMSLELYKRKIDVLNRHCDQIKRDPSEIRHTVLVPTLLSNDKSKTARFIEAIGPGTIAGPAQYIIDRIGELSDAGVDEIMFGRIPNIVEEFDRIEKEILTAFV
jgi:alkanesulfonate monooxygenase SsuD/methylene tetrahydromethanopterin reductase-like flavin-dependent oxidoreductase (luciferase family)